MSAKYFCLIPAKDANSNPANLGWKYCKDHQSEWIAGNSENDIMITVGAVKGMDFIVVDDKVYFIHKTYEDITNQKTVILCKESEMGCDML